MKLRAAFLLIISFPLLDRPLLAHHGTSSYDLNNPVTLKGTVTEFVWSNPHVQIYFDVKDQKGNVVHWSCATLNPGKLVRPGWSKGALKPGDQITVTLAPAKSGKPDGWLWRLVLANGKELGIGETQD